MNANLRTFILLAWIILVALVAVWWSKTRQPAPVPLTPRLTGQTEYCLTCHADVAQISPSHPAETFGCVLCHGGERLALNAELAHSTMRGGRNPSDLAVAGQSCGGAACHSGEAAMQRDHIPRVRSSLQATYAGAIAQVRRAFGAQAEPGAQMGVMAVVDANPPAGGLASLTAFDPAQESNPSVRQFGARCLTCHLSAPVDAVLDVTGETTAVEPARARLTGCAACHTPSAGKDLGQPLHTLTTSIPYAQCNTCHNRGNYSLVDMQFHNRTDQPGDRLHDYYQPIAQFSRCEWTLDCADCHTRKEAMGDGHLYSNQKEMQYVTCATCHGTRTEPPRTRTLTDPQDVALRLAFLNPRAADPLKLGDTIVVTEKDEPLWNLRRLTDGSFEMIGKAGGTRFDVPLVMGSACEQKADEQTSSACHECHAVEK